MIFFQTLVFLSSQGVGGYVSAPADRKSCAGTVDDSGASPVCQSTLTIVEGSAVLRVVLRQIGLLHPAEGVNALAPVSQQVNGLDVRGRILIESIERHEVHTMQHVQHPQWYCLVTTGWKQWLLLAAEGRLCVLTVGDALNMLNHVKDKTIDFNVGHEIELLDAWSAAWSAECTSIGPCGRLRNPKNSRASDGVVGRLKVLDGKQLDPKASAPRIVAAKHTFVESE
eukprot:6488917-Amphidinium_carterae.4